MIVFQRLSTCPTVPELLSREAERRAARWLREMPVEVWLRPATAAIARSHRNNRACPPSHALPFVSGSTLPDLPSSRCYRRPDAAPDAHWGISPERTPLEARQRGMLRFKAWTRRRGMDICFVTATCVLATTRAANHYGLLSPVGLEHALTMASRLTRAGMRMWRSSQSSQRI